MYKTRYMKNRQTIFILSDPYTEVGSLLYEMALSPFMRDGIETRRITSDFITSGELIDHPDSVLVLPGSNDGNGYRAHMNGAGWKNEKSFLEAGGHALHICASAYMGHESYGFDEKDGRVSSYTSLTPIFSGHAHGPIRELYDPQRPWRPLMNTHDVAMLIHYPQAGGEVMTASAYSAGPRLPEPSGNNTHVIARFRDATNQPPAILAQQIGKGCAVISSPAIEINGAAMINHIRPVNEISIQMRAYAEALAEHEPGRSSLWEDVWTNYLLPTTARISKPEL